MIDSRTMDSAGGMERLHNLFEMSLSRGTAEHYCATIKAKAAHARTIRSFEVAKQTAYEVGDPLELATLLESAVIDLRACAKTDSEHIRSLDEIPLVFEAGAVEPEYIIGGLLVKGTVNALTGESGSGKSTFVLDWIRQAIQRGIPVVVLDRENPRHTVLGRLNRMGVPDVPLVRFWGGWCKEEAVQPGSSIVRNWAKGSDPKPLIIVDSYIAFLDGDENDAALCRRWFTQVRGLANMGCTVVILHHTGKSESSKDYRGSSDFRAAVDVGFLLSNSSSDGLLDVMRLKCWKCRYGSCVEQVFHYRNGRFEPEASLSIARDAATEHLTALLRTNPGIKTAEFERLAAGKGLARPQYRSYLERGLASGMIVMKREGPNGRAYYLRADLGTGL